MLADHLFKFRAKIYFKLALHCFRILWSVFFFSFPFSLSEWGPSVCHVKSENNICYEICSTSLTPKLSGVLKTNYV